MANSRLAAEVDRPLMVVAILLAFVGIAFVFSATANPVMEAKQGLYLKQFIWLGIALAAAAVAAALPYRVYEGKLSYLLFGVGVVLLVLTLFVGHVGLGAQRWLGWGQLKFQPSELAKVVTVLVLATILSDRKTDLTQIRSLFKPCLLAAIPFALVLKQPDLGTSVAFLMIVITMLFWAGLPPLYLFLLVTPLINVALSFFLPVWILFAAILALVLYRSRLRLMPILIVVAINLMVGIVTPQVWNHLEPYQRQRVTTFLDPNGDPYGAGYQIIQSKIAIGSGQMWGKGFMNGTQKGLAFLPEQHTDFIFSVWAEEHGFAGSLLLLALYFWLIASGVDIAGNARDRFGHFLAVGVTAMLFWQVTVNIGMVTGVLPVVGVTLPLMSYGGSSLLSVFLGLGLLLNVAMRRFVN